MTAASTVPYGKLQRNRERITVHGLNDNHNKDVKNLFKRAAISASTRPGLLHDFYVARVEKGDAADHGPSYPGTEGCRNHFNHVEERSEFRSPTVASASRLSFSGEEGFPSQDFLGWWSLRFGELGSRVSISR